MVCELPVKSSGGIIEGGPLKRFKRLLCKEIFVCVNFCVVFFPLHRRTALILYISNTLSVPEKSFKNKYLIILFLLMIYLGTFDNF